jgi:hypothetical protein
MDDSVFVPPLFSLMGSSVSAPSLFWGFGALFCGELFEFLMMMRGTSVDSDTEM